MSTLLSQQNIFYLQLNYEKEPAWLSHNTGTVPIGFSTTKKKSSNILNTLWEHHLINFLSILFTQRHHLRQWQAFKCWHMWRTTIYYPANKPIPYFITLVWAMLFLSCWYEETARPYSNLQTNQCTNSTHLELWNMNARPQDTRKTKAWTN